ncbi:MAG: hypothetical protein ACYDH9_24970 [Limisphaerales bacterium]
MPLFTELRTERSSAARTRVEMEAKPTSTAQKRETSLRGPQRYRITVPPPGYREVDGCLEFHLLSIAPWLPQKYHLVPAERELLDHKGLYRGLNLDLLEGYGRFFNERLNGSLSEESFFSAQQPLIESLVQCHQEAVGLWNSYADRCQGSFRNLHDDSEKNRKTIRTLLVQLEARKHGVERLQQCMARIAGKKTDPIIDILKMSGDEPAVAFGSSLVDTKRDLESLENHCKLERIAIADAGLLLHLVERGFTPEDDQSGAAAPEDRPEA